MGMFGFIFGNAAVVFQDCEDLPAIIPLDKQCTAITAQGGVDPNQSTGTWIHDCVIKAADGTGR